MKKILVLVAALVLLAVACDNSTSQVYTVRFLGENGEVMEVREAAGGTAVTKIQWMGKCTHDDHGLFLYWSEDGKTQYDFSSPVSRNIDLKPVFDMTKYKVTMEGYQAEYFSGSEVVLPSLTKEGHTLNGFASDDVSITDGKFTMPSHDVTVKALWIENSYSLTFTDYPKYDQKLSFGKTITLPSPDGVTAWKDENGNEYNPGAEFTMPACDLVLSAIHQEPVIRYTLELVNGDEKATENYEEGSTITLPSPDGVTSWKDDKGNEYEPGSEFTMPGRDVTLTAVKEVQVTRYTLTLINGDEKKTENHEEGSTITLPSPDGVTSWKDGDGNEYKPGSEFTMPGRDVTLTAVKEVQVTRYTLTLINGDEKKTENHEEGSTITLPSPDGVTSWKDDKGNEYKPGSEFTMPGRDVTLTAVKETEAIRYSLTLKNGKVISSKLYEAGESLILPSPDGIYSWMDEEGNEYTPGATFIMPGKDVTLTAVIKYELKIITSGVTDTEKHEAGEKITLEVPEAPEGHSFSTWKSSEVTITDNNFTMPEKNVTVEAIFIKNSYKVIYNSEGSTPVTKTVEYGAAVSLDNPFEKDGYEFEGWLLDGEKVTSLTMPSKDINLTAVWKVRTYKIISYELDGVTVPEPYESGGNKYFAIRADKGETIYIDIKKIGREGYTFKDFTGTTGTSVSSSYGSFTSKFEVGDSDIVIKGSYEGEPQKLYTNKNYNNLSDSYVRKIPTGEPIGDVSAPSRSDYDFVGWAYDREGNSMYSPDDLMHAKSVTLYAIWREKPRFTVNFSSNVEGFSMEPQQYHEGKTVTIDDFSYPSFTGYTHKGFAVSDSEVDFSGKHFIMPARDVEIRVLYDRNTYTIRCKINDDDAGKRIQVPYGELIRDYIGVVDFVKQPGWSYDWIIHYNGGSFETLTDQVAKDGINHMMLKAYQTQYKLTLSGPDGSSSTTSYYGYGTDISVNLSSFASSLTTTISEFSHWETADGSEFKGTTMPSNDLKLTAVTKDRYYTFTFLEKEGDETGTDVKVKYGDPLNVPPFSKAGCSITSWNSVNYKKIQLPLTVTEAFLERYGKGNNVFHPTWTLNSNVQVTYTYGGTSVTKTLPMGADVLSPSYVSDIIGEYDSAEKQLEGIINGDSYQSYKANSDTKVILKLNPRTYTVSCYVYLDSSKTSMRFIESMSVPFGSVINTPERPKHEGYEFTWENVPASMPADNVRIYGLYTPKAGKVIVHKDSEIDLTKGNPDYTVLDVTSSGCVPELPIPPEADGKSFVMYISKTGVGERTDVWAGDSVSSGIELYPVLSAHRFDLDRETKTATYLGAVAPNSVTEVNIPSSIMMYTVTGIADRAFAYYSEKVDGDWVYRDRAGTIRKVTVPSTVTQVGEEAFYRSGVETVEFESGSSTVSFMRGAFSYAKKLISVQMPVSYTLDGADMFLYCESLKNFTVPSFISVIPKQTFAASGLETVVISEGIERIDESAFYMADNLGSVVLPSSLKSIGDYAFSGDVWNQTSSSLSSVTFSEGLEEIGVCAFRNTSAEEYKTPNSVKRIGTEAFSSCKKLKRVYLGSSLEMIYDGYGEDGELKNSGGSIFAGSDNLSDVLCNLSSGPQNFVQTLIDLDKRDVSPKYNQPYSL